MKFFRQSPLNRAGRRTTAAAAVLVLSLMAMALPARAQDAPAEEGRRGQGGGRGAFAGMQRVAGEVVSVSGANVTVKAEDGSTVTVVTTDNTRIMKGRGNMSAGGGGGVTGGGATGGGAPSTIKVAELKPGDGVTAAGILDAPNKTLHAAMLIAVDAATVKAMRDNLGKTYITGRVTAIDLDNAKLTVERSDRVSQTIGLDESTSFRRGRAGRGGGGMGMGAGAGGGVAAGAPPADAGESITLADVKVGDQVGGQGEMKGGTFVPKQLTVMTPGQGRRNGQQAGQQAGQPGAGAPPAPPPSL